MNFDSGSESRPETAGAARRGRLTARERLILGCLMEGACNKAIANSLGCSVRTVEFHITNLLRKANVSSRLELVTSLAQR